MYMSARKPSLLSKTSGRPSGLRKNDVGTVDQSVRNIMPGVSKTSLPHTYSQRNNRNPVLFNTQRGGTSSYQTTNLLFSGNPTAGGHCETVVESNANINNNNNNAVIPEDEGGVYSSRGVERNSCGRGVVGRRPQPRGNVRRNVSDNVAAVLGGSSLTSGGERLGNGVTRKAFSGPPSTRLQSNQQGGGGSSGGEGEAVLQRPHPPGSGGPKVGGRHTQFVLNANSNRKIPPLLPRPSPAFGPSREGLEATSFSLRHGKGKTQDVVDSFATTHTFNGMGSKFGLESDSGAAQWGKNTSQSFALASVKPPQLDSPYPLSPSNVAPILSTTSLSSRECLGSGVKLPGAISKENVNKTNSFQYEFRVVASTGNTFNSPIKLTVGVGCLQGLRPTMEDEHFIRLNVATAAGQPLSLLGILDGHCGRRVAELASKHVPDNFIAHSALGENNALAFVESIIQADRAIFHALGKGTNNGPGVSCTSSGGSTLIAAAVHGRMLYVACLGDARAVLYDGNKTIPMSEDHKPTTKKEHTRILQCGGFVQFGRVCGILAVSRALGDYEFKFNGNRFTVNKELMVSNVADVRQINLTDSSKFLLMACDGLWDVVENEEATQFVRDFLSYTPDVGSSPEATKRALNNCCQKLAEFAVDRGSTDNVSVMLLFFHDVIEFNKSGGGLGSSFGGTQTLSPRLSYASRTLDFEGSSHITNNNNNNSGGGGGGGNNNSTFGIRRPSFGSGSPWHSGGRSIW